MFDLSTVEGLAAAQAALTAKENSVTTPAVTGAEKPESAPIAGPTEETDGPFTEKEAIHVVQNWVAEDNEVELPERMSSEDMIERLQDAAEYRTSKVPASRFKQIVAKYAPDAPHRNEMPKSELEKNPPYPAKLKPLVESGVATFEYDVWLVKRCNECGQFKNECCGRVIQELAVRDDGTLTSCGRQATGLDPIRPPKPPQTLEQIQEQNKKTWEQQPWWTNYRAVDELEGNGTIKMFIENFLPEGTTIICGLPKEGKSWVALSIAKALTSGNPLFGQLKFSVPEITPVLYLAAESGDSALKLRCEKMGITKDKNLFLARTLSQGPMFGLDDNNIQNAVRAMRPIVILETLIRFNDGKDEDNATENRKLAESIFRLISWGARAVIGIHHSRKDLNKANPTKESAVRGSGDGLAMVDAIWLVMQDERMYQRGKGPNEIDIVGWGRDFNPLPMRLALTKKTAKGQVGFAPGIASIIDSKGDLEWVDKGIVFDQGSDQRIEQLIAEDLSISKRKLAEKTGLTDWEIRTALKRLGYRRAKGGKKGAGDWIKGKPEPMEEPMESDGEPMVSL
jgi:hypothetical protein